MKKILVVCSFLFVLNLGFCQHNTIPLGHKLYQFAEINSISTNNGNNYSFIKPYSSKQLYNLLSSDSIRYVNNELRIHSNDTIHSKKPILKNFFAFPESFFSYSDKNIDLKINPVIHFSIGKQINQSDFLYVNSRGVEVKGLIDNKIGFYTFLTENQAMYPSFVNIVKDSTISVPFEGFWKQIGNGNGVDFLRANGYINAPVFKSISAQLGYGKHFMGNGYRSLVMSNFSNNYPYFKLDIKSKIFSYTSLFAQLIGDLRGGAFGTYGIGSFSTKYLAFHHLTARIKPNFHVGLFESVIHGDSTSGFKFAYANPIIFYRAVEQQNGSSDNALLGMDFKWTIKKKVMLYGQLAIDELIVGEVFSNKGWWGNKQAFQLGAKFAHKFNKKNSFIIQGEINKVRPYMYAHESGYSSYTHYNQPLAHPLGANFTEFLGRVNYLHGEKWQFQLVGLSANYGSDFENFNYGKNVLKDYSKRPRKNQTGDYGNTHLQGNKTNLLIFTGRVSYMLKHNLFFDADVTYRKEKDEMNIINRNSSIFGVSMRWNMPSRTYLF